MALNDQSYLVNQIYLAIDSKHFLCLTIEEVNTDAGLDYYGLALDVVYAKMKPHILYKYQRCSCLDFT